MPIDERSAKRLRKALASHKNLREVKMFGGLCFMLNGHMLCGTGWNGLMFRVGAEQHAAALERGARAMEQKGRQMLGFVWVEPSTIDDRALKSWLDMARQHVETLPPRE